MGMVVCLQSLCAVEALQYPNTRQQTGQEQIVQTHRVYAAGKQSSILLWYLQLPGCVETARTEPVPSKAFGLSLLPSILTALYWLVNKLPATSGRSFII